MTYANALAATYNLLQNRWRRLTHDGQFKHLPVIFGKDSTKIGPDDKGESDKYNGIFRFPRGFVAQFKLVHEEYGPLVVTLATHDPNNLGTLDPETGEYVMTPENLESQTYLVSALPVDAHSTMFQDKLNHHFARVQAATADLDLLGYTQFIAGLNGEEKKLFMTFLSAHVAYGIMERKQNDFVARAMLGNGRMDFESPTLTNILPADMRNGVGSYLSQIIKLLHQDKEGDPETESFPHTESALRAVMSDWNWRISRLWNNQNLNPNFAFRLRSAWEAALQKRLHHSALATGGVALGLEYYLNNLSFLQNMLLSVSLVLGTEILAKGGESLTKSLLDFIEGSGDLDHQISLKESTARDYAYHLYDPHHRDLDRPAKKIDPRFAGRLVRLKAVDPDGGTDIRLPFDDADPVDPSQKRPADLWLANWDDEVFGTITRIINPHSYLVRSQNGLISAVINTPPDDPVFGRSDRTIRYTTCVDLKSEPTPTIESRGVLTRLKDAFNYAAQVVGLKTDPGPHRSYTPGYNDVTHGLKGRIQKMVIDRRNSSVTTEWLEMEPGIEEIIKAVQPEGWETATPEDKCFYGLGDPISAARRLRRAFGLPGAKGGIDMGRPVTIS